MIHGWASAHCPAGRNETAFWQVVNAQQMDGVTKWHRLYHKSSPCTIC
jgi:hypothetical protein